MAEENAPETPPPFDPKGLDDAALTAEYDRIRSRGQELSSKADLTAEELAEFKELGSRVDVVSAELSERAASVAAQNEQREKFGTLPEVSLPQVVIPTAVTKAGEQPPAAPEAPVAVVVPSVAELGAQTPVQPVGGRTPEKSRITAFVSNDAAGFIGKSVGEQFDGITEISDALIRSTSQYGRVGGGKGARHAIAQFHRNRGDEFTIKTDDNAEARRVLDFARSEARLHGGSLAKQWQHNIDQGASLTAAAGWCAPSENDYDLCRLWSAGIGLIDLPTVTVRRGGLNYTAEPTFQTIYANAVAAGGGSNFLTEAQVIADTAKTCSEIPCPSFTNRRLDVLALCIRVSFLQAAGYPELVNLWTDGLLASNEQEMNRLILADMITAAGAATVPTGPDPDPLGNDSFTAGLLQAVGLAAEDIRYQRMMPWTDTVEIILPHWVLAQIRTDLSRRSGDTGNLLSVTDQYIASLFSAMNVRVQFVRGWQDGLITGGALNAAFPGGDIAPAFMLALPTTVSFLAYPAGSIAVARQDVVTLTNVYDAASLAVNEFTSLFAEEGFAPVYPCGPPRLYTTPALCVAGTTGAHQINCVDETP